MTFGTLLWLNQEPLTAPLAGEGPTFDAIADTFDLTSEEPGSRISHRRAYAADPKRGPALADEADHREVREWVVTIRNATPAELFFVKRIWDRTSQGTMPMLYPARVSGEDEDAVVVFADQELERSFRDGGQGSFEVRLREWRG